MIKKINKNKYDNLKVVDKFLETLLFWFSFISSVYYWDFVIRYLLFIFCFGVCIFVPLFCLYAIPHIFRDLSSEYITEDLAEQRLEDDFVYHAKSDQTIIDFWEHHVHHNYFFEFWRSNYWLEELDEEWDFMHRRGFNIKRFDYLMSWLWMEHDWGTNMPTTARGFPTGLFPEYWPEELYPSQGEELDKKVIPIGEEDPINFTHKGLASTETAGKYSKYTRWWVAGSRKAKILKARKAFSEIPKKGNFQDIWLQEVNVHEETEYNASDNMDYFTWLDTPEGIASIKELEDIVVNDDDWEFSDD